MIKFIYIYIKLFFIKIT